MHARWLNGIGGWAGRTVTRKFTLLLAGFLVLQATMLIVGVTGVLHLGEEGGFINEAGRQRYRTLLVAVRGEEALAAGKTTAEVSRLLAEMDAYFGRFRDFLDADRKIEGYVFHDAQHADLRAAVAQAEEVWFRELRPLAVVFAGARPAAARQALARYKELAPQQVARLEAVVSMLERDVRTNTFGLARFSALLLAASLGLGALGFFLVWRGVTRPLRRLIETSHAIAAGAYDRHVRISSMDELGDLAETFNRMADAVGAKTARIMAFNRAAGSITSSLSAREILDQIMYHGIDVSGAKAACLAFYDEQTGRFDDRVTRGLSDHFVKNMSFRPGGLADETFVTGSYILSNDLPGTKHRLSKLARDEGIRSFICLPLTSHTSRLGVVYFYRDDRDTFLPDEVELLQTFAYLAAGALENARLYARVDREARIDSLTGLLNRREFDARLAAEHARAQRYGKPYAFMMLDIDRFKEINDTYGHAAGDAVLETLAGILKKQFRDVDTVARYGGEEFTAILPEISGVTAKPVAERVRRAVAATPFRLPDGREIGITASIGVSCYPNCADTSQAVVDRADQALYVAKEAGRNRVVFYREMLKKRIDEDPSCIVALLNENLENIRPIVIAVSAKGAFFHKHTDMVEQAALKLAQALRLSANDTEALKLASRLHDIGMAVIPDAVLNKTTNLTEEEWAQVRRHPAAAAVWLEQVPALKHLAPLVRHHHERFDGGGYPDGLKGGAAPYLARVLAVVDAYASMVAEWPGRAAGTPEAAVAALRAGAGTQFDPEIVAAFVTVLEKKPG